MKTRRTNIKTKYSNKYLYRAGFLDVGIGLEINALTSKFILLGYQMLGEMCVTLKYASTIFQWTRLPVIQRTQGFWHHDLHLHH